MALATEESIRDRLLTIIELVDPVYIETTRFLRFRQEGAGDIFVWSEANPSACLRRVSVRSIGEDEPPAVSNTDYEERRAVFEVVLAYPQTHRYGAANALDRDDVITSDWREIDFQIGLCGRGNFGDTYDCTPLGCRKRIERRTGVDFLVIEATYIYKCDLSITGALIGVP